MNKNSQTVNDEAEAAINNLKALARSKGMKIERRNESACSDIWVEITPNLSIGVSTWHGRKPWGTGKAILAVYKSYRINGSYPMLSRLAQIEMKECIVDNRGVQWTDVGVEKHRELIRTMNGIIETFLLHGNG